MPKVCLRASRHLPSGRTAHSPLYQPINRREERDDAPPQLLRKDGKLPVEFGSDLEDAGIAAEGISRVVEQRIADCGVGLDVAQEVIQGVCVVG